LIAASNSKPSVNYYDANYGNFHSELYGEIRRAAFGEDIGQSGWQTAAEQDQYLPALSLASGKKLLDVCCGSGGPALRIAHKSGCALTGIDLHQAGISTAKEAADHELILAFGRLQGAANRLEYLLGKAIEEEWAGLTSALRLSTL